MENYIWTGNADELINAVQRAFIVGNPPVINSSDLGIFSSQIFFNNISQNNNERKTLKNAIESFKKEYVTKILEENSWNQTKTAKVLGIPTYLCDKINK